MIKGWDDSTNEQKKFILLLQSVLDRTSVHLITDFGPVMVKMFTSPVSENAVNPGGVRPVFTGPVRGRLEPQSDLDPSRTGVVCHVTEGFWDVGPHSRRTGGVSIRGNFPPDSPVGFRRWEQYIYP